MCRTMVFVSFVLNSIMEVCIAYYDVLKINRLPVASGIATHTKLPFFPQFLFQSLQIIRWFFIWVFFFNDLFFYQNYYYYYSFCTPPSVPQSNQHSNLLSADGVQHSASFSVKINRN